MDQPTQADEPILTYAGSERRNEGKEVTSSTEPLALAATSAVVSADGRACPLARGLGPTVKEQLFLSGLLPVEEFIQVTADQVAPSAPWPVQWQMVAAYRQALQATEAGIADNPQTGPLPPELEALLPPVLADDVFQQTVANTAFEFRMVEVDKLVVYQKHINVEQVEQFAVGEGGELDPKSMIDLCFPLTRHSAPAMVYPAGSSLYVVSESSDIRPLAPRPQLLPLDHAQVSALLNQPPPRTVGTGVVLVLLFGYSLNFLHALSVDGRLVLNNAYHRAYALRRRGRRLVPCLVQTVTREQLPAVVPGSPLAQNPDLFLKAPRPPLFKDFFDGQLHIKLTNRPTRSMFRVTARFEVEGRVWIH
jgi:hypothetical protein